MGRKPSEKVIEHRITFGSAERRYMDEITGSIQFKNYAGTIIDLLKDVTGLAALYVILNSLFPQWSNGIDLDLLDGTDDKGWRDYFEMQNIAGVGIGIGVGFATGGLAWLPAIIGAVVGTIAVEGSEEIFEDIQSTINKAYAVQYTMLSLRKLAMDQNMI